MHEDDIMEKVLDMFYTYTFMLLTDGFLHLTLFAIAIQQLESDSLR